MACLEGCSKKNRPAWLGFAKLHVNKPQDFRNNIVWTDEINVEMLAIMDSMQQENDPNRLAEKEKNQGVAVAQ